MHKNSIPFVSITLSALACILAAVALSRGERAPVAASPASDADAEHLQELTRQTSALRAEIDRLAAASRESPSTREPMEKAPEPLVVPPELLQRLNDLEQSVASLRRKSTESAPRAESAPGQPVDLVDAQRQATDPRATEAQRLAALKALRGQKVGGQDARTRDVILSMLDLAEHSQNESTREDVYRNLHGSRDPQLKESMLRALANDPSARVRERAARDIDTFLPDPVVESALRLAADTDTDPGVRAQAQKTLSGGH